MDFCSRTRLRPQSSTGTVQQAQSSSPRRLVLPVVRSMDQRMRPSAEILIAQRVWGSDLQVIISSQPDAGNLRAPGTRAALRETSQPFPAARQNASGIGRGRRRPEDAASAPAGPCGAGRLQAPGVAYREADIMLVEAMDRSAGQ